MGILTMSEKEYDYQIDNIREGFSLIGQEAVLYQVDQEITDMYHDYSTTYKKGIKISVIFERNPQPLLKKYGWVIEGESEALVAHVVSLADDGTPIEIRENMKICLVSSLGLDSSRMFKVSKVVGNSIPVLTWICKLVPYRFKTDTISETEEYESSLDNDGQNNDFSYLKVDV